MNVLKTLTIIATVLSLPLLVCGEIRIHTESTSGTNAFPITSDGEAATIVIDSSDALAVRKVAKLLSADIERVTGKQAGLNNTEQTMPAYPILIGSLGKNRWIQTLADEGKIDLKPLAGQWERYLIQTVSQPFPGVEQALVIVGSDRRGTAYGVFELSEAIGVSPWYFWADVPIQKHESLYVDPLIELSKPPSVKYRGIFLNDEDWGLQPWAAKVFEPEVGDIGPRTYEAVFELLLRLKGNMVAPAMHSCTQAFFTIPGNMAMADDYGIMITTAHCEPLLYNNASEWDVDTQGVWNYVTNREEITSVLDERVEHAASKENIYTIALRGMHDEGMLGVDQNSEVRILEEAALDQRAILSKHIHKPIDEIPQIFVPYKEVLGIYERGMKLPEDITIVWPDDNYGYLKKLSNDAEQQRSGGSGVYYHISYLGWPNDYLWLNTTPPSLMYSELHKAYSLGADKYWLVNVGDIKPGEMGMQFFLDMAWDFSEFSFDNVHRHEAKVLASIFGEAYEEDIAYILDRYYYHGFTRKPEFMTWDFRWNSLFHPAEIKDTELSFINYGEAESRLNEYEAITAKARAILEELPESYKASFFQLVYYPVAGASLYNHQMLVAQKNRWYAQQNRALTSSLADEVEVYQEKLADLTRQYNDLLGGKWNGMMTAPGFLPEPQLPPMERPKLATRAELGVFVEGFREDSKETLHMPVFSSYFKPSYFFEVYNKGSELLEWRASASKSWIQIGKTAGGTQTQDRVRVSIDWASVPQGESVKGEIEITHGETTQTIEVSVFNPASPTLAELTGHFVENNGAVSISPTDFHRKQENDNIRFQVIEGLGYTNAALQLGNAKYNSGAGSYVEYDFYTFSAGAATIKVYALPLFSKDKTFSTSYGIQVDDQSYETRHNDEDEYSNEWASNVIRNSAINTIDVVIDKPGKHTLKLFCEDPGMIIQKIVIDLGGLKDSYLGPDITMIK